MTEPTLSGRRLAVQFFVAVLVLAGIVAGILAWAYREGRPTSRAPAPVAEAGADEVHRYCAACHAYPPPDSFPRGAWRKEVDMGFHFGAGHPELSRNPPRPEAILRYYEARAPEALTPLRATYATRPLSTRFDRASHPLPGKAQLAVVTHVSLAALTDPRRPEIVVCDVRTNRVLALDPRSAKAEWRTLAEAPFPAHAEVVDLDGDGRLDLIVACLGHFTPTDDKVGGVLWLRGGADGSFTPVPLLEGVGRVADVQAGDLNGDGKIDLTVAVFGWRQTGEVLWLENRTTDYDSPTFVSHVLDRRNGAIHVPIADLNGDGHPDVVALVSQEHEEVVAHLNDGKGNFEAKTVFKASHPAWGFSGLQVVDLDGDGRLDVLTSNGDILDPPYLLKPYHGVSWLKNEGRFPFTPHELAPMYGVMRATAADLDGDGDQDVLAVAYLPRDEYPTRAKVPLDAVVVLEQTAKGQFVRHALETGSCDHLTCAVGDLTGDGRSSLVVGNGDFLNRVRPMDALTIWLNRGPATK